MKLTQKGHLAIKCMIILGQQSERLSIKAIAEAHDFSQRYLEQIFSTLKRHHLVDSTKGPSGGYTLKKSIGQITLKEIIEAVEGQHSFTTEEETLLDQTINVHLNAVDDSIDNYLNQKTLKDLIETYQTLSDQYMYYI